MPFLRWHFSLGDKIENCWRKLRSAFGSFPAITSTGGGWSNCAATLAMAALWILRGLRSLGVGLHRLGKSRSVTKIENKIVAVSARVGFPVEFESIVSGKTHNALIGPGRRENILLPRERK